MILTDDGDTVIVGACDCSHGPGDHYVSFTVDAYDDLDFVYCSVGLERDRPFWFRVKTASRHVFGRTCNLAGGATEVLLTPEDARRLGEWLARKEAKR